MICLFSIQSFNEGLYDFLILNAELFIHILELVGLYFIVFSAAKSLISFFKRDPKYRLELSQGLATGLEFKLGGEILRTVVVRNIEEIMLVGGIIALRIALTLLIHWEIKNEEKNIEKNIKEATKDYALALKDQALNEKSTKFLSGLEEAIHQSSVAYFKEKAEEFFNDKKENFKEDLKDH